MIIQLPQNVANQIAAGEVVQRPASIVKELLENSIDAGAMSITLKVLDGGQTLIQVIDDGIGMDAEDAVKSFLRHATSKIRTADDLYNLHTFGFRGEALASISSVSEVEMRTRRAEDMVGVQVNINGGSVPQVTEVSTAKGTNIVIKNIFFNTPARRKFLKSVQQENKHIMYEFERVALVNPDVEFQLIIDNRAPLKYAPSNLHQRIVMLTNKTLGNKLLPIEANSPIVRISGYIAEPSASKKKLGEQYFFVNGRFMRNPYLAKAVEQGFGKLLPQETYPSFFIYIEVEPSRVDVNIHPTKSEVKFEEEAAIFQIISSAIRQTLGKHNILPAIDFDNPVPLDIPSYNTASGDFKMPKVALKSDYNPFKSYDTSQWDKPNADPERIPFMESIPESLIFDDDAQPVVKAPVNQELPMEIEPSFNSLQWGGRYIATTSADGILLVDYPRAMQRIAFEKLLKNSNFAMASQRELHPQVIELSACEHSLLLDSEEEIEALGFSLSNMGGSTVAINAMPAELIGKVSAEEVIEALVEGIENPHYRENRRESLAKLLTRNIARTTPRILRPTEITALLNDLLSADEPSYTPDGLAVIEIINPKDIFR